jgi:hypothetical protein
MRISCEIFAIALDRVALKGRGVSFGFGEANDGSAGRLSCGRRRGRRRFGRTLKDEIRTIELRGVPRQERTLGLIVHRHARLVEDLGDVDAALSHRAGQRLGVDAVGTGLVAGQCTWRGIEGDEFAGFGIDESEARRQRRALRRIGIGPRSVDDDYARPAGQGRESVAEIGNPKPFDRHVGVVIDRGVDGDEIVVAIVLNGAAGKVDEGLHVGPRRRRFVEEVAEGQAQRLTVEVPRADNVKSRRLQRLGDEPCVVGGRRQSRVPISRIPDD